VRVVKGDLNDASQNIQQPVMEVHVKLFHNIVHYCFVSSLLCGWILFHSVETKQDVDIRLQYYQLYYVTTEQRLELSIKEIAATNRGTSNMFRALCNPEFRCSHGNYFFVGIFLELDHVFTYMWSDNCWERVFHFCVNIREKLTHYVETVWTRARNTIIFITDKCCHSLRVLVCREINRAVSGDQTVNSTPVEVI